MSAGVAQLVEQLICNQPVASSSLVTSFPKITCFKGFRLNPSLMSYNGAIDFTCKLLCRLSRVPIVRPVKSHLAIARYRTFLEGTALTGDDVAIDRLWCRRYWNPALKWIPVEPLTRESMITAALHYTQNALVS
jgi:hypothetical protein